MIYTKKENVSEQEIVNISLRAEFVGETDDYAKKVNRKIREKYSLSDELAILRKALVKLGVKYKQLEEYNAFVEQCKQEVNEITI